MSEIIFALWFYLPAGNANMAPVFAKKISFLRPLDRPLDFGKTIGGKRIFGDHKTFRGLLAGYVAAWLAFVLQVWLYQNFSFFYETALFDYSSANIWLFAAIFSLGALGGDAIESFFKRQINIKPGKSWVPFDQADWIVGAVLLSLLVTNFEPATYLLAIVWGLLLHPISTLIGWSIKLKDKPI